MTWVKLDDGFTDHPKVFGLSDRAFRVHIKAMCYCARFSPGVGRIAPVMLKQLGASAAVVAELTTAGLWDDTLSGLCIHDFAEYHPKPKASDKVEAGRRGGVASGEARRSKRSRNEAECFDLVEAEPKQSANPRPVPSRPDPDNSLRSSSADDDAEASNDGPPAAVREMRDALLAKLPLKFSRELETVEQAELFATDYAGKWAEFNAAIDAVRRTGGELPFPSNLRKHMPALKPGPKRPKGEVLGHDNPEMSASMRPEPGMVMLP
jgi:hypothetical protein